ncbi:hypothetical protein FKG94_01190 [Exilibacterium tricleocarpae]|uniref:VOC domain-containing protein n=2 Tax=Exilibacterium tricleocarpae TaxID=2591008 RepID=A0A545U9U4_9GAMM|nr:hypothetical protein FKG94_01190 [Exilibacterium tricleocarpae]
MPLNRLLRTLGLSALVTLGADALEVDPKASIRDASTSVLGINHIGLSVRDLDKTLAFYQQATGFELVKRERISGNRAADKLYGRDNIAYEIAVLKAPNMLLELTAFKHNAGTTLSTMPVQGPGMTHTCFQSPAAESGYEKFVKAGARLLSRGDRPVDIGGYGVTYAYAYDPEGNMIEVEQLEEKALAQSGYDSTWVVQNHPMWMSQVGLATHDIERLMAFYQKVLGFAPYRAGDYDANPKLDQITAIDQVALRGGWFRMNDTSKVMEFWQYKKPATPALKGRRDITDLGYSFSIEVGNIQEEYRRLKKLGVAFTGEPVYLDDFWQVYAQDPDGNVFALRQAVDPQSVYSVNHFDRRR